MGTDKADENNAGFVSDGNDQTIFIALDVEHYTVVSDDAGVSVNLFDIGWVFPISVFGICIPGS